MIPLSPESRGFAQVGERLTCLHYLCHVWMREIEYKPNLSILTLSLMKRLFGLCMGWHQTVPKMSNSTMASMGLGKDYAQKLSWMLFRPIATTERWQSGTQIDLESSWLPDHHWQGHFPPKISNLGGIYPTEPSCKLKTTTHTKILRALVTNAQRAAAAQGGNGNVVGVS